MRSQHVPTTSEVFNAGAHGMQSSPFFGLYVGILWNTPIVPKIMTVQEWKDSHIDMARRKNQATIERDSRWFNGCGFIHIAVLIEWYWLDLSSKHSMIPRLWRRICRLNGVFSACINCPKTKLSCNLRCYGRAMFTQGTVDNVQDLAMKKAWGWNGLKQCHMNEGWRSASCLAVWVFTRCIFDVFWTILKPRKEWYIPPSFVISRENTTYPQFVTSLLKMVQSKYGLLWLAMHYSYDWDDLYKIPPVN